MFTRLDEDLNVHQSLSDEPNIDDGLSADELKAKFDEPANKLKAGINRLIKEIEVPTGGSSVGALQLSDSDSSESNVQAKLAYLMEEIQNSVLGVIPDGSITKAKLASTFANIIAEKDGTIQQNLNAEMLGGQKISTLFAGAKYHIPTYTLNSSIVETTNAVPTLQSNSEQGYNITASVRSVNVRDVPSTEAYLLFSNSYNNRFGDDKEVAFGSSSDYVIVELPEYIKVKNIKTYSRGGSDAGLKAEGSLNGVDWVNLGVIYPYRDYSEQKINVTDEQYYKYIRIRGMNSSGIDIQKINFEGKKVATLDNGKLDLSLGFTEYIDGQRLCLITPNNYDKGYTNKLQLDNLGYKAIPKLEANKRYTLVYNGSYFELE